MVPGVQVARIDANKWAVSIRGLNGRFANKLLVLMDGRSLYTQIFSGVFWDVQDTIIEDIDRIEVIRGPGAALWGANAVNGVINIITKSAKETTGGLASAGGGTEERAFAAARYGMELGKATDLRLYAKYNDRDNGVDASGNQTYDAWRTTRGGFRLDSQTTDRDTLTLQGDYYDGKRGETRPIYRLPTLLDPAISRPVNADHGASGGNILSRWQRTLSDASGISLQFYYDHAEVDVIGTQGKTDLLDMEFQHRLGYGSFHDIVWGLGYRFYSDDIEEAYALSLFPQRKETQLFSVFLHDEISLLPERLSLILGSRVEHNYYSGFEIQPNGRLLWTPTPQHTLWAAISRAVRTPSRGDQDLRWIPEIISPPLAPPVPFPANQLPAVVMVSGSPDFRSEDLLAYELGYRTEPLAHVSLDIATFYNVYDHLRTIRLREMGVDSPASPTHFIIQYETSNDLRGYTYGAELKVSWTPLAWWRLQTSYSYLKIAMKMDNNTTDPHNEEDAEGGGPRHQFSIRSWFDIGRKVELDLSVRGADRLPSIGGGNIPAYITLDARLAWKPVKYLELSLIGQNLLQNHHEEFRPELMYTLPTEVERSVYGKVTWNF
jgi:iron complex outermembrane receptor protein